MHIIIGIYLFERCVYKEAICLHGSVHMYTNCIFHKALYGYKHRMFLCKNSIESIICSLCVQNMYLCIGSGIVHINVYVYVQSICTCVQYECK